MDSDPILKYPPTQKWTNPDFKTFPNDERKYFLVIGDVIMVPRCDSDLVMADSVVVFATPLLPLTPGYRQSC